jgi:hypothetical protein
MLLFHWLAGIELKNQHDACIHHKMMHLQGFTKQLNKKTHTAVQLVVVVVVVVVSSLFIVMVGRNRILTYSLATCRKLHVERLSLPGQPGHNCTNIYAARKDRYHI